MDGSTLDGGILMDGEISIDGDRDAKGDAMEDVEGAVQRRPYPGAMLSSSDELSSIQLSGLGNNPSSHDNANTCGRIPRVWMTCDGCKITT